MYLPSIITRGGVNIPSANIVGINVTRLTILNDVTRIWDVRQREVNTTCFERISQILYRLRVTPVSYKLESREGLRCFLNQFFKNGEINAHPLFHLYRINYYLAGRQRRIFYSCGVSRRRSQTFQKDYCVSTEYYILLYPSLSVEQRE